MVNLKCYYFFLGKKDEFAITKVGKENFSFFFLRHEHVFIFGKGKLSFACEQLVSIGIVHDCRSL